MLQLEKEIWLKSKIKFNIFHGFHLFRSVACCGYLTSNQKVLFYTTHIKK